MTILSYFLKSKKAVFLKKNDLTSEMQNHVKNHFSLQKIMKITFMTVLQERRKEAQFKIGDTNPRKTNTITM